VHFVIAALDAHSERLHIYPPHFKLYNYGPGHSKQSAANVLPHYTKVQRAHVRASGQHEKRGGLHPQKVKNSGVCLHMFPQLLVDGRNVSHCIELGWQYIMLPVYAFSMNRVSGVEHDIQESLVGEAWVKCNLLHAGQKMGTQMTARTDEHDS